MAFYGCLTYFLCSKSELFWQKSWFLNGRKSDSFWLCSMVLLENFVLKIIIVLTKFKICQHKFDPKSDSLWWDSEVFLHTFLLIVWFISTKLMILLHSLGPEFDAYWWQTELSLNFFVLKAYVFLAKFIKFNLVLTSNVIHMMDIYGCITYFCAEHPIYFDQFYDFWTSLWPKVWFILIVFNGFIAYFCT